MVAPAVRSCTPLLEQQLAQRWTLSLGLISNLIDSLATHLALYLFTSVIKPCDVGANFCMCYDIVSVGIEMHIGGCFK